MRELAPPSNATQTRAERIADGVLHATALILAVTGAVLLILLAAGRTSPGVIAAVSVYAAALVVGFAASASYHMLPWDAARPVLRRIDHAAIYLKIAGTYTPLVALMGSAFAWVVLGVVWTLAAIGAAVKLFFWATPGRLGVLLYLLLGWLSLALIWPLAQTLPRGGIALIVAGGLLYTAGTMFFLRDTLRFQNAIWHGFVLAASGCFFAAIAWGVAAAG